MSDAPASAPPEWVAKRDGQLVPFEADKISRSLFAAAESLGQTDAFLARELTDSIVHFLAAEVEDPVPTTAQIAEVVVKVVRELGHPTLAIAYATFTAETSSQAEPVSARPFGVKTISILPGETLLRIPGGLSFAEALQECGRQYALQTVFTRDLLALHNDGLIALSGLDRPGELAASLLELHKGADQEEGLFLLLEDARRRGSSLVVLDGPEHLLAPAWPAPKPFAPSFARRLDRALRLAGMRAVVNLNAAVLPVWADDTTSGPLFHSARVQVAGLRDDQADHLAREWSSLAGSAVRIDWHLGERDFVTGSPAHDRLLQRLQEVLRGANLTFVFDRQCGPVALAEGMTRRRPALLLQIGLNLPRLAEWTGTSHDTEKFLEKLGSLTRLALSAGVQKREFLRDLARTGRGASPSGVDLTSGFLLDRAALVFVPVGLDHLVQAVTGHSMTHGAGSLELGRRVVQRLRDVLRESARGRYPEACLDGPVYGRLEESGQAPAQVGGLTPWDPNAAIPNQLRAAGVLHAVAEAGTVVVTLHEEARTGPVELLEALGFAWEKTDIVRLRFARATATQPSLPFRE